jgi:hypothetical protein
MPLPDEYLPGEQEHTKWGRLELLRTASESDMAGEVNLTVQLRDGEKRARGEGQWKRPYLCTDQHSQ